MAERYDATGDMMEEEISQPEGLRLRVCPGGEGIAAEAMDSYDIKVRLRLAKPTGQGQTAASGSSGRAYSMADDVVASFGGYTIDSAMHRREPAI